MTALDELIMQAKREYEIAKNRYADLVRLKRSLKEPLKIENEGSVDEKRE